MFCPKCRAEYRKGFTECSDCNISLVSDLPQEPELEYLDWVTIFASPNPATIAVARSVLQSAGIQYVSTGETLQVVAEWSLNLTPIQIHVPRKKAEEAKALLKDLT